VPVLFYAQYLWGGVYRDVYTGLSGDPSYWHGKTTLSVDYNPVATESFNTYYSSSYGSYAYVVWRNVGDTVTYYWVEYVFYDKSTYIGGLDERYRWIETASNVGVTDRAGSFTVPSRSGTNPVIIRARYDRHIYVTYNYRPTSTEASPYTPGSISYSPSDANLGGNWWKESVTFTANPNTPYFNFGEWHEDGYYNIPYSTNPSVQPYAPKVLTADFYPRVRVYVDDVENYARSGVSVTFTSGGTSSTVNTDSSGYAAKYFHPYSSITVTVPSSVNVNTPYGAKSNSFWKWSDGLTSTTRSIQSITRPADLNAKYKVDVVLVDWGGINGGASGGGYGGYAYYDVFGLFYAWESYFPRNYLTMGVVVSQHGNLVSGVSIKTTIYWTQFGTGQQYNFDITTTTISTKSYKVGFVRPYYCYTPNKWMVEIYAPTYYAYFNYYAKSIQMNWDRAELTYGKTWITGVPDGYEYDQYITYPSQGMLFHANTARQEYWNTGSGFYLAVEYP